MDNIQTEMPTSTAGLQPASRPTVNSDGRFVAGPAIKMAMATPKGKPAETKSKVNGSSKKVGMAISVATNANSTTATVPDTAVSSPLSGSHHVMSIESTTPSTINGSVWTATLMIESPRLAETDRLA